MSKTSNRTLISSCKFVCLALLFIAGGCSFLDIDPPDYKIKADMVFADDDAATGAIAGIYLNMYEGLGTFADGTLNSITSLAGLSSDELINLPRTDIRLLQFQENQLLPDNNFVLSLWTSMYKTIYETNSLLEGLSTSSGITPSVNAQLKGEALVIRSFCYFYLVNSFGDVPLVLTTDYRKNSDIPRTSVDEIYKQIEKDLLVAEELLVSDYPVSKRVRINRFTATALLARMYLYRHDWQRAEDKSSNVINSTLYSLPTNVNSVFSSSSTEAIWQLKPADGITYTNEGRLFGTSDGPKSNGLNEEIVDAFEPNDKRLVNWITKVTSANGTLFLPFKYKVQYNENIELNEYSTVLRLAEQYLIRAEARAQQDKLSQSVMDIDIVRRRAGISLVQDSNPNIGKDDLLLLIENERRLELFSEWGHRWYDLKRLNRAETVLGVKANWSNDDELYPLPSAEIRNNKSLSPQNPGY